MKKVMIIALFSICLFAYFSFGASGHLNSTEGKVVFTSIQAIGTTTGGSNFIELEIHTLSGSPWGRLRVYDTFVNFKSIQALFLSACNNGSKVVFEGDYSNNELNIYEFRLTSDALYLRVYN